MHQDPWEYRMSTLIWFCHFSSTCLPLFVCHTTRMQFYIIFIRYSTVWTSSSLDSRLSTCCQKYGLYVNPPAPPPSIKVRREVSFSKKISTFPYLLESFFNAFRLIYSTVGHKSHDPWFHVFLMERRVMTFVAHCTFIDSTSRNIGIPITPVVRSSVIFMRGAVKGGSAHVRFLHNRVWVACPRAATQQAPLVELKEEEREPWELMRGDERLKPASLAWAELVRLRR